MDVLSVVVPAVERFGWWFTVDQSCLFGRDVFDIEWVYYQFNKRLYYDVKASAVGHLDDPFGETTRTVEKAMSGPNVITPDQWPPAIREVALSLIDPDLAPYGIDPDGLR